MDQSVHDLMVEIARNEGLRSRPSQSSAGNHDTQQSTQSSEPVFPSSDRPEDPATPRPTQEQQPALEDQVASSIYVVRPFGLDKTTNLRDLNPSGMYLNHATLVRIETDNHRHGSVDLHQGPRHPNDSRHPGHEGRLFPMQRLQPLLSLIHISEPTRR